MSRSPRKLLVKCALCGASYEYSKEEADGNGIVKCQNCGSSIQTTEELVVRCPVCFSENVAVEGNRVVCTECGLGREMEATGGPWYRVDDIRVDLLPKYLEMWPHYWNKIKGWRRAGTYLRIRNKSEIAVGRCRVISIPMFVYGYATAVIALDIEQPRCWVTIQSWYPFWTEMTEMIVKSFMTSVAACNDTESSAAERQAPEQQ